MARRVKALAPSWAVVVHAFSPTQKQVNCGVEASLLYGVSSKIARASQTNPVMKPPPFRPPQSLRELGAKPDSRIPLQNPQGEGRILTPTSCPPTSELCVKLGPLLKIRHCHFKTLSRWKSFRGKTSGPAEAGQ